MAARRCHCGAGVHTVGEGTALTVRTDIFGRAEATLTPPTSEDLQDVQQAALETSLAALAHDAATPAEAVEGLRRRSLV